MTNEELRNYIYVSLISADNDELSEDEKQQILNRHKVSPGDWAYILEPIKDERQRQSLVEILNELSQT